MNQIVNNFLSENHKQNQKMNLLICSIIALLAITIYSYSQLTIADWNGNNQSFTWNPLGCVVTAPISNPNTSGINTNSKSALMSSMVKNIFTIIEFVLKKISNKVIICTLLLAMFYIVQSQTEPKKVLIHYMGWYDEGNSGRHWNCGHAHTPLIGYYDSHSWATLTYQILLSNSCGIDGLVINLIDDYDAQTIDRVVQTVNRLYNIDSVDFKYSFSISYDDQGLPDLTTAELKFIRLRDTILPETKNFLSYSGTPVIFLYQYGTLTPSQYHTALTTVFPTNIPKLIRNEIDANSLVYASSFYAWVQPGSNGWNGSNWGQDYLTWYYNTLKSNYSSSISFACGGVWAGFNDSINHCWGQNRGIKRQNGTVYNSTWAFINNYSGNPPMQFVYISTWNDWNEGTEIEPSVEDGYKYLKLTIDNINTFKGTTISADTFKFEVAKKIYNAASKIEKSIVDSALYYPLLKKAIVTFLQNKYDSSAIFADSINNITNILNPTLSSVAQLYISPNPATSFVQFQISTSGKSNVSLAILDLNGCLIEKLYSGFLPAGYKTVEWNTSGLKKGMYFSLLLTDKNQIVKKIILL